MYREIWIIMLVLSFISLVVGVVLLFIWNIPSIIDELSSRKAKRQIKMLHELNANSGVFEGVSTNEFYSSIPSSSFLYEELSNIDSSVQSGDKSKEIKDLNISDSSKDSTVSKYEDIGDEATSYIEDEEATSMLVEDESTAYLSEKDMEEKVLVIKVLKEESSL